MNIKKEKLVQLNLVSQAGSNFWSLMQSDLSLNTVKLWGKFPHDN